MMRHSPAGSPFTSVDEMPSDAITFLIAALEATAAHPDIRRVRAVAQEALRPAPGQRLLDAGCGAGEAARGLAAAVSPAGEVVALDISAAVVAAAAQRHDGSAVRYVIGDVTALELPDGGFDGVRCERVLQHVTDADRAVAELIRVTRVAGRVCLIDTDWDSMAVDGLPDDLVYDVRGHLYDQVITHHRDMGRTLRRRLVRAGLAEVTATPVVCCFPEPGSAARVLPMFNPQIPPERGMIPDALRRRWFAEVDAAGVRGEFLAAVTIWVATGTRAPAGGRPVTPRS